MSSGNVVVETAFRHELRDPYVSEGLGVVVGYTPDGSIQLVDYDSGEPRVTFYRFPDASLVMTPEGFFSGTGEFLRYLQFVRGLDTYALNQFYDAFYRPDIVDKKIAGDDIAPYVAGLNVEEALAVPPPIVEIVTPSAGASVTDRVVAVRVRVVETGDGGIGDIRLHHNGKLVQSLGVYRLAQGGQNLQQRSVFATNRTLPYQTAVRGAEVRRVWSDIAAGDTGVSDFSPLKGTTYQDYEVVLVEGENLISASAFNGANTVMSVIESVAVFADIEPQRPELHVLSVGNNEFSNPALTLRMAEKDANDFSAVIGEYAPSRYAHVNVTTLSNVGKQAILEEMARMSRAMKPEDVFVFFAATHGYAEDDSYYVYTSEFDGTIGNPNHSLSSVELMELSKQLPALKQAIVLDACQAGGMEGIVAGLYDARMSVLARAVGVHLFAGAKSFQAAQDVYEENGLFTHFLLEGLKGGADHDASGQVSSNEMGPFLERNVSEASGGTQVPFVRAFGDDLLMTEIGR